ncbi:hypothetical protein RHO14_06905 [Orbus wheelerorum]|uniref:hypothetical protein n=1 Tax=Orbus wheelerorum TaxID=3074111 RepID=UPI00370D8465
MFDESLKNAILNNFGRGVQWSDGAVWVGFDPASPINNENNFLNQSGEKTMFDTFKDKTIKTISISSEKLELAIEHKVTTISLSKNYGLKIGERILFRAGNASIFVVITHVGVSKVDASDLIVKFEKIQL